MAQYYYTVASLPALRFEEDPFLSREEFLEYCRIEVAQPDIASIEEAKIWYEDATPGDVDVQRNAVLRDWVSGLQELQRQTALIRAQALGRDTDKIPRPDVTDAGLVERLRQILNEDTPLKTETALLRLLWQRADAMETGHHFDCEKLIVYHLKLQIAARRARLHETEAGRAEFDRQYEEVAQSLMEIAT